MQSEQIVSTLKWGERGSEKQLLRGIYQIALWAVIVELSAAEIQPNVCQPLYMYDPEPFRNEK